MDDSEFNPALFAAKLLSDMVKKEDKRTAMYHIKILILFGLRRGFCSSKTWAMVYSNCSDIGKDTLKAAVLYYDVKLGKQTNRSVVTIPRLIVSFPKIAWDVHWIVVRSGRFVDKFNYEGKLPICLRYTGSPAIMNDEVWRTYGNDFISYSESLSVLWKSTQSPEEIKRIVLLTLNGKGVRPEQRVTIADVTERENEYKALLGSAAFNKKKMGLTPTDEETAQLANLVEEERKKDEELSAEAERKKNEEEEKIEKEVARRLEEQNKDGSEGTVVPITRLDDQHSNNYNEVLDYLSNNPKLNVSILQTLEQAEMDIAVESAIVELGNMAENAKALKDKESLKIIEEIYKQINALKAPKTRKRQRTTGNPPPPLRRSERQRNLD